jgi:hypothetical protein
MEITFFVIAVVALLGTFAFDIREKQKKLAQAEQ